MKKILFALIFLIVGLIMLCACAANEKEQDDSKPKQTAVPVQTDTEASDTSASDEITAEAVETYEKLSGIWLYDGYVFTFGKGRNECVLTETGITHISQCEAGDGAFYIEYFDKTFSVSDAEDENIMLTDADGNEMLLQRLDADNPIKGVKRKMLAGEWDIRIEDMVHNTIQSIRFILNEDKTAKLMMSNEKDMSEKDNLKWKVTKGRLVFTEIAASDETTDNELSYNIICRIDDDSYVLYMDGAAAIMQRVRN